MNEKQQRTIGQQKFHEYKFPQIATDETAQSKMENQHFQAPDGSLIKEGQKVTSLNKAEDAF